MQLEAVIVSKLSQSRTIKPDSFSSAVFQEFYIVMSNVYILSNRLYTYNKWKFVSLSGRKGAEWEEGEVVENGGGARHTACIASPF